MAKRTVIELVDDLDNSPAAETVTFGLDGTQFEIDLSQNNAAKLREAMAPYVSVARTAGRRRRDARRAGDGRSAHRDREQLRAIREWAKQSGLEVAERGRIPAEIEQAYNRAH
jgi:hypothetical protein